LVALGELEWLYKKVRRESNYCSKRISRTSKTI